MIKRIIPFILILITLSAFVLPQQIKKSDFSYINKKYLLGKVDAANNAHFRLISAPYTSKSGMYLEARTDSAFRVMYNAAAKDGINLQIVSAFRSFYRQKSIWEAKWTGTRKVMGQNLSAAYPNAVERAKVILMYSAMPGTSRHHWGTDIDIYSVEDQDFESGKGKKIYEWLRENAAKYGFCQVYTPKGKARPTGYEEEKWHWSYKPVAEIYLSEYEKQIKYTDISGFKGDRTAEKIKVIENYVLGINPDCKKSNE
jgi:LAS superfamily LD-carboxypeptidase LdcB